MACWLAVSVFCLLAWMPANAHAAEYTIGPVPTWVVPVAPGVSSADQISQGSDGEAYLLTDMQTLAAAQQRVTYRRLVTTALNASGVESIANIEIPFDPSYQTLVLHSINVVRDGRVIAKLATAKIQVLQRETELETRIYDGTKTVNVFLDDIRVGDTVDYAYSTTGRNPVFKGADFGTLWLQFSTPVARTHARVLLPIDKQATFAPRNTAIKPSVSEHDGLKDYVWDVVGAPVLAVEKGAPDWYSPHARIDWSEFPDWAAVAHWAQPLYQVPATLSPALQAQVERIAKTQTTPTGRMLAALQLVQSEVRYLGVEIGQNSHAPNPPALVFDRRFGDCKDKTLLTLTLLDRLGIEAHAALVNTDVQRGLADALPNPGAFDHVIVQARVAGKIWWIDPTRYVQKADAAHLVQPDYGLALIVEPRTQALTPMRRPDASASGRSLTAVFDASAGFDKPVHYSMQTVTVGDAAESLRASLSSTNLADVQKNYLNFYANGYPHITVAAPLEVAADEANNRIVTKESYVIADMSSPSADKKGRDADIRMPDIMQVLRDPEVAIRKAPLQLAYPLDVSESAEVLLPDDWPPKSESTTVEDAAFRFEHTVKSEGARVIITDHFQSLGDEVAAKDMPRYLANLARAREMVGYELWWATPASGAEAKNTAGASGLDRMNWPVALLALAMLGFSIWLAVVVYRYDPSPRNEPDHRWVGMGGWLLLLAVVLALRPFIFIWVLTQLAGAMSLDKWSMLATYGGSKYNAAWAPVLLFELAVDMVQLVLSVMLLLLFFKRRSSFPRVALILLLGGLIVQVSDLILVNLLPAVEITSKDATDAVRGVFGVAIWSAYLLQSRRVRATFVKRYRVTAPPPLPQANRAVVDEPVVVAALTESRRSGEGQNPETVA